MLNNYKIYTKKQYPVGTKLKIRLGNVDFEAYTEVEVIGGLVGFSGEFLTVFDLADEKQKIEFEKEIINYFMAVVCDNEGCYLCRMPIPSFLMYPEQRQAYKKYLENNPETNNYYNTYDIVELMEKYGHNVFDINPELIK